MKTTRELVVLLCVVALGQCDRSSAPGGNGSRPKARTDAPADKPATDRRTGVAAPNAAVLAKCLKLFKRHEGDPNAKRCAKDSDCVCLSTWESCGRMVSRRHMQHVMKLQKRFKGLGCSWTAAVACVRSNCGAPSCVSYRCRDQAPLPPRPQTTPSKLHAWVPPLASRAPAAKAVRSRMQELARGLDSCFTDALKKAPMLNGSVEVRLVIRANGNPHHVVARSKLDKKITDCVKQRVLKWRLPPSGARVFGRFRLWLGPRRAPAMSMTQPN